MVYIYCITETLHATVQEGRGDSRGERNPRGKDYTSTVTHRILSSQPSFHGYGLAAISLNGLKMALLLCPAGRDRSILSPEVSPAA